MTVEEEIGLAQFVTAFAQSVVEAQRELDRRYLKDMQTLARAAFELEQAALVDRFALLPSRARISESSLSTLLSVRTSQMLAFSLQVKNAHLRYEVAEESAQEWAMRLDLTVEQIPAPDRSLP